MTTNADIAPKDLALLHIKGVRAKCSISEATIYRLIQAGTFPKPYKVGTRSLWLSTEVDAWIMQQVASQSVGQNMGHSAAA
ncbi:MAG TPA: AlpA family phage regulatory protein [Stenotrophomonas sp.]|nr:AlpA family phage regulatory protein [Stenotrophomonas sp.]